MWNLQANILRSGNSLGHFTVIKKSITHPELPAGLITLVEDKRMEVTLLIGLS